MLSRAIGMRRRVGDDHARRDGYGTSDARDISYTHGIDDGRESACPRRHASATKRRYSLMRPTQMSRNITQSPIRL